MHDDYWRRLATDPDFEAEMCERQRELGMAHCWRHARTMAGRSSRLARNATTQSARDGEPAAIAAKMSPTSVMC
jgi:hypothetical protein